MQQKKSTTKEKAKRRQESRKKMRQWGKNKTNKKKHTDYRTKRKRKMTVAPQIDLRWLFLGYRTSKSIKDLVKYI